MLYLSLGISVTVLYMVPVKNVKCLLLLKHLQSELCPKQDLPLMKQKLSFRRASPLTL